MCIMYLVPFHESFWEMQDLNVVDKDELVSQPLVMPPAPDTSYYVARIRTMERLMILTSPVSLK